MKQEIKDRIAMIKKGEVPEGYKKIDLGLIPADWCIKGLSEIATINKESINNSVSEDYKFKYYDLSVVDKGRIYHPVEVINFKDAPSRARRKFNKNNILMSTVRPYLKGFALANFDTRDCIASTGFAIIECNLESDVELIYQSLFSFNMEKQISGLLVGSNYPAINSSDVAELKIPFPEGINERKLIGKILSTWDKAIELKEKLIEEKKKHKRGLMQKLLSGEVRLPGFDGEWKEVRLGKVLKERVETNYESLELLAITSREGIVKRSDLDAKDNSSEDKSKYKRICPLDIGYNTMRMWQGVSAVSEYEGIVSPAYTILRPVDDVDSYFFGYLFKMPNMINLFWRHSQGLVNDTLNLKYTNFKLIKARFPVDISEQKAIANILSTAHKEISLLEQELASLKLQKKGLMQLLLTGIVRVNTEN